MNNTTARPELLRPALMYCACGQHLYRHKTANGHNAY